jgi:DNA-binding transcriptional ArsR family regulator
MERDKALLALSALANDARLDLLRLLMRHGKTGLAAGEIGHALGHSASRLSFHLSILEQAGLIRSRRESRKMIYWVDLSGIGGTISYLLNDCCCQHPEVLACCGQSAVTTPCRGVQGDKPAAADAEPMALELRFAEA